MEMEDPAAPAQVRPSQDLSPKKNRRAAAATATDGQRQHPPADACFDCNICLDFAADPVVTLCGHLYCWPCIYKWLRLDYVPDPESDPAAAAAAYSVPRQQQCPVCKAALSESALVPLYGRGIKDSGDSAAALAVPRRPLPSTLPIREDPFHSGTQPSHRRSLGSNHAHARQPGRDYVSSVMSSTVVHPLFHGVAMLPFLLSGAGGGSSPGMYYAAGRGTAERRQELQSARSLQRVSGFLFLCAVLCLLLF